MNNNQGIGAYFVAPAIPAAGASLADADAPRAEEAADIRRTADTEVGTEQTAQPSSSNEPIDGGNEANETDGTESDSDAEAEIDEEYWPAPTMAFTQQSASHANNHNNKLPQTFRSRGAEIYKPRSVDVQNLNNNLQIT